MILPEWLNNFFEREKEPMKTMQAADDEAGNDHGNNFLDGYNATVAAEQIAAQHWNATIILKERIAAYWIDTRSQGGWTLSGICPHRNKDGTMIFVVEKRLRVHVIGSGSPVTIYAHDLIIEQGEGFAFLEVVKGGGES